MQGYGFSGQAGALLVAQGQVLQPFPHRLAQALCGLPRRRGKSHAQGRIGEVLDQGQDAQGRECLAGSRTAADDGQGRTQGEHGSDALPVRFGIVRRRQQGLQSLLHARAVGPFGIRRAAFVQRRFDLAFVAPIATQPDAPPLDHDGQSARRVADEGRLRPARFTQILIEREVVVDLPVGIDPRRPRFEQFRHETAVSLAHRPAGQRRQLQRSGIAVRPDRCKCLGQGYVERAESTFAHRGERVHGRAPPHQASSASIRAAGGRS